MLWILIITAIVLGAIYYFLIKHQNNWTQRGVKQKKPTILFGENLGTLLRRESTAESVERVYNQFPDSRYSGFYQFTTPVLLLREPELIKQITVKDFDHFTDHRIFITEDSDPLLGRTLFSLSGQKWRNMRATLSPSFTSSKMKFMFDLMIETADKFTSYFEDMNNDEIHLEMKDVFTRYTNDVIASIAFGVQVDSLKNRDNEFYLMGKDATDFTKIGRIIKMIGYLLIPKIYKIYKISLFGTEMTAFFRNLVKDTIRVREKNNIFRPDMLNLLMEVRKGTQKHDESDVIETGFAAVKESEIGRGKVQQQLTDDDLTAQVLIFFLAGFESVSALMCFAAYELGVNQDIQERLRLEINETLKKCDGKLTYEHLTKMKYMDMVISETLRKWPNAVGVDRICTKPYTIEPQQPEENPVHLKKNDVLFLPIYGIHRDPQYYPDPEKFDPERFNDENKANIKPYTYIPFGAGPRNCIASRFAILETKVLFFYLLKSFKIVPNEKTVIPLVISKKNVNLTADGGFWFNFEKIENLC